MGESTQRSHLQQLRLPPQTIVRLKQVAAEMVPSIPGESQDHRRCLAK